MRCSRQVSLVLRPAAADPRAACEIHARRNRAAGVRDALCVLDDLAVFGDVVLSIGDDGVAAGAARDRVFAWAAGQPVVAGLALDGVVAGSGVDDVVARSAADDVVARQGADDVVPLSHPDVVCEDGAACLAAVGSFERLPVG